MIKIPDKKVDEERFILTPSFRKFYPWPASSIILDWKKAEQHGGRHGGGNLLSSCSWEAEREESGDWSEDKSLKGSDILPSTKSHHTVVHSNINGLIQPMD